MTNHKQIITTKIIIIGTGPAGITAAIQLTRCGLKPVLLEKDRVGGLLWNANLVENYPGFPNGIPGPKLVALFNKQMQRIGVEVTYDEVVHLDCISLRSALSVSEGQRSNLRDNDEIFVVETRCSCYHARFVVVASGTKPCLPEIEIAPQARERVFSEVVPLLNVSGKHIAILGAGDAAFDYALNLASRGNTVTILNHSHEAKCLPMLWERAQANLAITYHIQTAVQNVEADDLTGRLRLSCTSTNHPLLPTGHWLLVTDYLLFAIGREPQLDFLSDKIRQILNGEREENSNISADSALSAVNNRLFFVGDVVNGPFRQAAIAAGDGLRAAMQIYAQIQEG